MEGSASPGKDRPDLPAALVRIRVNLQGLERIVNVDPENVLASDEAGKTV
jgi:hypothetical protein